MSVDPKHIQVGMEVFGLDGELIGTVKSVTEAEIEVNRPWARDLMIPIEAVQAILDASASHSVHPHVVLTIRARSVDAQGWPHPA